MANGNGEGDPGGSVLKVPLSGGSILAKSPLWKSKVGIIGNDGR